MVRTSTNIDTGNVGSRVRKTSVSASRRSSRRSSFFVGDGEGNKVPVKIIGSDDQEITPDDIVVPPDGGYGYVIVFAAFMSNVIVDGIVFSFGSLKDSIFKAASEHGIHLDQSTIAWVGSLLTGFYLMAGPFVSAVANRFGFRTVAIIGCLIASFAFIMSWYLNRDGPKIGLLYIFYGVIGGIGFSCMYVPAVIAVGFYFEKKRALATGIAICGSGIGGFIFPPLITFLVSKFEWNGAIFIMGLIVLLCGLLGCLYRPLKPQKARRMSIMAQTDSPMGTPLLMRIKRARDIMKQWDSGKKITAHTIPYNDALKAGGDDIHAGARADVLYSRGRKSSTPSLKGVPSGSRLSVPTLLPGDMGEVLNFPEAAGALVNIPAKAPTLKAKRFVGLPDLQEIEETASRENSQIPEDQLKQQHQWSTDSYENMLNAKTGLDNNNENGNLLSGRNGSTFTCRIGNSMLMVDEMTNSKIIRVTSRVALNKPLYRDDIFYSGSLLKIPDYAHHPMANSEWAAAVSTPIETEDYLREDLEVHEKFKMCFHVYEIVKKMLDINLLTSPTFIVFSISGMFTMLGLLVPFVFLVDQAYFVLKKEPGQSTDGHEIDKGTLQLLLSVIGAANTVGRILSGWLADRPCVNALWLNNGAVTVMGLCTALIPLLSQYFHFIMYCCVFGISMSCFASLRSILVVELLGLAKLTNAFGLLLLFQGIASTVATPLAGRFVGGDGDPSMAFFVAGGFMLISAVMCYPLNVLNKWEHNRKKEKPSAELG